MKNLLTFVFVFLIIGCNKYTFEYGSSLANFQTQKFKDYNENKLLTEEEKIRFKKNLWTRTAVKLAPGNLPIRHYCLIDLFSGKAKNKRKIKEQLKKVGDEIWREGYSYWLFVKPFLEAYSEKFGEFGFFIKDMDKKFEKTAYMGPDGKLYPAPFGDIRHAPLEMESQSAKPVSANIEIYPLIVRILEWTEPDIELHTDTTEYLVQKCPVGFNTHVPDTVQTVRVLPDGSVYVYTNGKYIPFKWYEGYDKKYKDKEAEFNDTFSQERINSLDVKDLWKKYEEIFMK
jgi:hypothetical protein